MSVKTYTLGTLYTLPEGREIFDSLDYSIGEKVFTGGEKIKPSLKERVIMLYHHYPYDKDNFIEGISPHRRGYQIFCRCQIDSNPLQAVRVKTFPFRDFAWKLGIKFQTRLCMIQCPCCRRTCLIQELGNLIKE